MYAAYFGLKQDPFSIAPDPRYLFMSERHREALAHLLYGLSAGGGFVLLSGEIGTGKTTVCRLFLEQIPADCNVAYIFNPKLTATELLQSICDEFHIKVAQKPSLAPTVKDYLDPLNEFLLQAHGAGRNSVLIIDEAQNLSAEVLEQLRLLTNLETRERKLLQIILIGQPELREMLARPELEQLAQRVIARYHLGALTRAETSQYIQHRLEVAGLDRPLPFDQTALQRIHQLTRGVPRRINLLCDRALLGAFANAQGTADKATIDKAAAEVFDTPAPSSFFRRRPAAWAGLALGIGVVAGAGLFAAANNMMRAPQVPAAMSKSASAMAPPQPLSPSMPPAQPRNVVATNAPVLLRDQEQAWRELARAWNAELGEGRACRALQKEQLQCFSRNLSLAMIRELGRPGILTLDSESGVPSYALLTALTRDNATLRAAGTEQTVTLVALAARWKGEFATLWRAPPGYAGGYAGGATAVEGETIEWIANSLALVNGLEPASGRKVLDAQLRSQLKNFQTAHGLVADGFAGPLTLMQLNRAAGIDEPRLRMEP